MMKSRPARKKKIGPTDSVKFVNSVNRPEEDDEEPSPRGRPNRTSRLGHLGQSLITASYHRERTSPLDLTTSVASSPL